MLDASRNAPFVTFKDEASFQEFQYSQSGNATDFLNHFGRTDSGALVYRNTTKPFLGLISGVHARDRDGVIRSILSSHLRDNDAQALILYCCDNELSGAPDYFPHSTSSQDRPNVLISPNNPTRTAIMYPNSKYSVNPLSFSREDISLRDILGLLTQTTNDETSVRLHNKVYLLLSQLSEPVELQRLSQLIDEENWNDEESTFIALRQTLLTKLEALEEDHPRLPSYSHRQTLVDLRDAVLQRTQLNVVLLNMVLREFLAGNPDRKKLIVVVDNERILEKTSVLSKSLEFVSDSGLASVLISTNDPSILSSPICQISDFIFHTPSNSPLWRKALMKHFPELKVDVLVRCPGSYIAFSPFSLHIGRGDGTEPIYEHWNNCCCRVSVEHSDAPTNMGTRGDIEVDANAQSEDHEGHGIGRLSSLPSPPLSNEEGRHRTSTTIHEETQLYNDDDFVTTIHPHRIEEDEMTSLMPLLVEPEFSQSSWPPISTVPTPQPPQIEADQDIVSRFPTQHQPLISAIISLNKPDITAPVEFEQLRKKVGKEVLQTFAWSTFTAFVKVACKEGYVEQWIEPDASVRVKLKFPLPSQSEQANNTSGSTDVNLPPSRPRSTTILSDNHNSLRDSLKDTGHTPVAPDTTLDMDISPVISTNDLQPDLNDPPPRSRSSDIPENNGVPHPVGISPESYPAKFQVLVKAILQLSDNRTNVPVGFEAVRQLVGNKDDIRALNVGFVTFTGMVNQASQEKCVRQEGTGPEGKRLALLPLKGAVQTEKLSKKPDPDMYPKQFRPLIRAIFKLSDGCINVAVDYEATRAQIGTIQDVQALGLGWNSFYAMVKAAANGKYVEENGKLLTALKPSPQDPSSVKHSSAAAANKNDVPSPASEDARSTPSQSTSSTGFNSGCEVDAADYPSELYPLVFSILSLTSKRNMTKVKLEDLWRVFLAFDGFVETSYQSIASLIKLGIAQGTLSSGTDENGRWVMLENPQPQWTEPPVTNTTLEEPSKQPQAKPPKNNPRAVPNYGRFSPLVLTLVSLREQFIFEPLAQPVVNHVLKLAPNLLARTGYATILMYLKAAEIKGFIKISGEGPQRAITLADEHVGANIDELRKQLSTW